MPGSIRLTVLDAFDITEAAGGDGLFVKASMGKKQFTTRVAQTMGGKAGPWDDEHAFSVLSLTDHLIISLLTASGKSLGSTQVTTPSIVEKGFRDEVLGMKDGKGHVVGQVHVKLSFVLSDEERKKIEAMRAKSLAKKGEAQNGSDAPVVAPSESVSSPSLNGKRSSSSKFSFNKAIENGQNPGEADPAAVIAELSQEVNAEVAKASTAAFQATADVAKQAQEAAASGPQEVASRASQTAQKASQVSEKAAGIAAIAAEQAASSADVGKGEEDIPRSGGDEVLLRRPSVKERVAALESPTGGSSVGDGSEDDEGEEARLAEDDWQRAEAVEEALRKAEQRKREEDSKKVGKAAAEAKRYEQEYLEQRQREEERKRKEGEKKKEQERRRAAKAAADAGQEAERRAEEEQRRAERDESGEEEAEEGAFTKLWQQVGGTLAFVVALFVLWPRDSGKGVASRRRVKLSGDTYVVKKGDTLDNIVGRMCYNPDSEFYRLNPEVCDRNTIYPGQVLRVPEYQ